MKDIEEEDQKKNSDESKSEQSVSDYGDANKPLVERIDQLQASLAEAKAADERKDLQQKECKLLR